MNEEAADSRLAEHWTPAAGAMLLRHLSLVCAVKVATDRHEQMWWMSHVALALAGMGLVLRSHIMVGLSLTCTLLPHAVWLADCVS